MYDKQWLERHKRERAENEVARFGRVLTEEERAKVLAADIAEEEAQRQKELRVREQERFKTWFDGRVATIPPRYKEILSDPEIFARSAFDALKDGKHDAVIFGENGVGKTFLAWALILEAWKRYESASYTTCFQMLSDIKRTYSLGETETREIKQKYTRPQLLVIDEFDKTRGTQDDFINIFDIIDTRYNNLKSTVIITNSPHDEVVKTVGKAVFSRLGKGGRVFTLGGDDKRVKAQTLKTTS